MCTGLYFLLSAESVLVEVVEHRDGGVQELLRRQQFTMGKNVKRSEISLFFRQILKSIYFFREINFTKNFMKLISRKNCWYFPILSPWCKGHNACPTFDLGQLSFPFQIMYRYMIIYLYEYIWSIEKMPI